MPGIDNKLVLLILVSICFAHGVRKNVALNKTTSTQSGVYNTGWPWSASGAVDGNYWDLDNSATCFHAARSPSDWTVDLGQEYQLYDIRIFIREGYGFRIANSSIYLDKDGTRVCYTFPSNISDNPTDVTCNETARYVTIRNPGTDGLEDYLNICEVEIYACTQENYGENCDGICHCSNCDRWTRICSGSCNPGWQGERCNTACDREHYGPDCIGTCANKACKGGSTCNPSTGQCDRGCRIGWTGIDCAVCDEDHYDTNCAGVCVNRHCEGNSSCSPSTGQCNGGCLTGWAEIDCTVCDSQHYGPGCNRACSERQCDENSSCSPQTGKCDGGCQTGWSGSDCKECDTIHFGENCSVNCEDRHCSGNSTCHHLTGSCDEGCEGGWTGADCQEACDSEHYGPNCTGVCDTRHCEGNSSCSPSTGSCNDGCQTGWAGTDCTTTASSSAIYDTFLMIGTSTGGVVVILIVMVIVAIVCQRRRQHTRTEEDTYHCYSTADIEMRGETDIPSRHYDNLDKESRVQVNMETESPYVNVEPM